MNESDRNTIRIGKWLIRWLPDDQQWQASNEQGRTIREPGPILSELLVSARCRRGQGDDRA